MAFIFCLVDFLLSVILSLDTLALLYQIRKMNSCDNKDFIRICFSWVLFLSIKIIFCCGGCGLICTIFGIVALVLKALIVIPKFGISQKLYKSIIEDKKGEQFIQKGVNFVKSKLGEAAPPASA